MNTTRMPPDLSSLEKQAEKLLHSMRIRAWYNFVVRSGVDLRSIRLKPRGVEGRDTYRRWNHWKNGNGKVEIDDLEATEKKVPNSRRIYEFGPEGARLWQALDKNSSITDEQMKFQWTLPWDEKVFELAKQRSEELSNESWMPRDICEELNILLPDVSKWHQLTSIIINYRKHDNQGINVIASLEEQTLSDQRQELAVKFKNELLHIINDMDVELALYKLSGKEIMNILSPIEAS